MLLTPQHLNVVLEYVESPILRIQLPPQSGIVLAFVNPPDVFGAISRLVHEVPAFEGGLLFHFGGGLAGRVVATSSVWILETTHVRFTAALNIPIAVGNVTTQTPFAVIGAN